MKHPLTSKERRGLVAVAAAALFCIASGFIFRNCSCSGHHSVSNHSETMTSATTSMRTDSVKDTLQTDSNTSSSKAVESREKSGRHKAGKKRKVNKKRSPKVYPSRRPLDQPIDQIP